MKLLLLLCSFSTHAMCVSTHFSPIAWSDDGQSIAFEIVESGPEGGGTYSLAMYRTGDKALNIATLRSNMSDGSGKLSESLNNGACSARLGKFVIDILRKKGFKEATFKLCREHRPQYDLGKYHKKLRDVQHVTGFSLDSMTASLRSSLLNAKQTQKKTTFYDKSGNESFTLPISINYNSPFTLWINPFSKKGLGVLLGHNRKCNANLYFLNINKEKRVKLSFMNDYNSLTKNYIK